MKKPDGWSGVMRYMQFGEPGELHDIEEFDWPTVKDGLRKGIYGVDDPLPVGVTDLGSLVAARPLGW